MRDRARFERYGGIELIKELIAHLPERKVFLAETIVRYATGAFQ